MLAKVTTAFADTLSPIPFPKRVQPAAKRELCLSEHPWNRLRALTLTEMAFKAADPQTLTPFYQSFCTSCPSWHCWGMFALQPGKARCCLSAILPHLCAVQYFWTLPGQDLPLCIPHTGVQKTDAPLFCLCRASVLGNYPHLCFYPAWLHSPPLVMLPGKWPLCCPTLNLTPAVPSHLGSCRRDIQTHPQEAQWEQYLTCVVTANGTPNPPSVTASSFKDLCTGGWGRVFIVS